MKKMCAQGMADSDMHMVHDKGDWDRGMTDNKGKTIVVYFKAPWCGPCRMITPTFWEFSKVFTPMVFMMVDIDEADDVASACGIGAVPTFQVWKMGHKVDEYIGTEKYKLRNLLENN
jgi:thioredoxin 1